MSLTKRWIEEQKVMGNDLLRDVNGVGDTLDDDEVRYYEEQEREETDDRNNNDGYVDFTDGE